MGDFHWFHSVHFFTPREFSVFFSVLLFLFFSPTFWTLDSHLSLLKKISYVRQDAIKISPQQIIQAYIDFQHIILNVFKVIIMYVNIL